MYILKNAFGTFWLWELGFRLTRLGSQEISHRFWGNPSPILGNASPILGMRHRFWGNPSRILRKSITDFGEIRYQFWGNASPILGKSMCLFWGKQAPFLGQTSSVWGKIGSVWGKLARFLDWLGTKLKSHCFER